MDAASLSSTRRHPQFCRRGGCPGRSRSVTCQFSSANLPRRTGHQSRSPPKERALQRKDSHLGAGSSAQPAGAILDSTARRASAGFTQPPIGRRSARLFSENPPRPTELPDRARGGAGPGRVVMGWSGAPIPPLKAAQGQRVVEKGADVASPHCGPLGSSVT